MRLNVKAMAIACAFAWGLLGMFLVGVANMIWHGYGQVFLNLAASFYPGYRAEPTCVQVALGTAYGLVDGALLGTVIAWVYNRFAAADCSTPNPIP